MMWPGPSMKSVMHARATVEVALPHPRPIAVTTEHSSLQFTWPLLAASRTSGSMTNVAGGMGWPDPSGQSLAQIKAKNIELNSLGWPGEIVGTINILTYMYTRILYIACLVPDLLD